MFRHLWNITSLYFSYFQLFIQRKWPSGHCRNMEGLVTKDTMRVWGRGVFLVIKITTEFECSLCVKSFKFVISESASPSPVDPIVFAFQVAERLNKLPKATWFINKKLALEAHPWYSMGCSHSMLPSVCFWKL